MTTNADQEGLLEPGDASPMTTRWEATPEQLAALELIAPHLPHLLGADVQVAVTRAGATPQASADDPGVRRVAVTTSDGRPVAEVLVDDAGARQRAARDADEPRRLRERLARLSAAIDEADSELAQMERLDRRLLSQRTSVPALLDGVLGAVLGRLRHARAAIALAEPFTSRLVVAAERGLSADSLGIQLDSNSGPVGQTLRSGTPRAYPARRCELDADGSVAVVPLLLPNARDAQPADEQTTGAILVATSPEHPLRGADLEFLRRVGVHGAVLLENARLLERLRRSEETYRTMVERAHLGMALLDRDGCIRHTNGPMREVLRDDVAPGVAFSDKVAARYRAELGKHLAQDIDDRFDPLDVTLVGRDVEVPARLSVTPIRDAGGGTTGFVVMARDLTREIALERQQKAMAQRVHQAEKLSAVGKFVAGIAHELNNPLTVVIGYAELLTERTDLPAQLQASLDQVLVHARRCGRIVEDLLKFSHHERTRPEPVHLTQVIEEALAATRIEELEGIALEVAIEPNLQPLIGSPHALCQLVTNVLHNAIDAVGLVDAPRRIRIALSSSAGSQQVAVEDNGPGFTEPQRVFDPFFTTKPIGKGTGLGLSICYGIARDHDGDLYAENMRTGGARLRIVLPEGREEAGQALAALPGLESETALATVELDHRPRLLVVDDEPAILDLAREALAPYCEITTAETVERAVQILDTSHFDVVLTDLRLPAGLTGADFYEIVVDRWPALAEHVAFMTGDTIGQASQAFLDRVRRPCLSKPFKIGQLVAFVKALV